MDIKDSGIECIKGEENLIELSKKNKKYKKDKKYSNKKNKNSKKLLTNDSFEIQKKEMVNTELSQSNSITSRSSICSENSISSSVTENKEGLILNDDCLFFYGNNVLIKDTIKWSFEYKVESILKPSGDSWQKLQPSKLKLPVILFFQNKPEEIPSNKKRNYIKYKSIVKKNLLNILERFSNSFVGVI